MRSAAGEVMTRSVLDVGNCTPDHGALTRLLESNFEVQVLRTHGVGDTLDLLRSQAVDLVLVNRIMDRDGSSGLELIHKIKADAALAAVPVMMMTNFPDAQQAAIQAGAEPGFGKAALRDAATLNILRKFLG